MLTDDLLAAGADAAARLRERGASVAVAEVSAGGLIAAALLAQDGASGYFRGGFVIYTLPGADAQLGADASPLDRGDRGATEDLARWLADAARRRTGATWAIGETGAAGPRPNPYGDPVGHSWVAVAGPDGISARRVLTGEDDRVANMRAFAVRALGLVARD